MRLGHLAAALGLFLAACQTTGYRSGDAAFATADEALAHTRRTVMAGVDRIPPLPAPIADAVTVVTPTRAHALALVRDAEPDLDRLDYRADVAMIHWALPAEQVRRRGAFRKVLALQAEAPSRADIEPGGYLLWLEAPRRDRFVYQVAERGADRPVALPLPDLSGRTADERIMLVLESLERYVRAHPAKTW